MKTMFIYDNTGKIFHWVQGDFVKPEGLPYIIVDDYNFQERPIERIDVSVNPHVPVYGLTKDELKLNTMTLDEYRDFRQQENKDALTKFLKENPILWKDGKYYGVTKEDQDEMIACKAVYDFKHSIGQTDWKLEWHSVKSSCREFYLEEFGALLNAIIDYVYPYKQVEMKYKELIYNAISKEELASIELVYTPIEDDWTK